MDLLLMTAGLGIVFIACINLILTSLLLTDTREATQEILAAIGQCLVRDQINIAPVPDPEIPNPEVQDIVSSIRSSSPVMEVRESPPRAAVRRRLRRLTAKSPRK